MRRSQNVLLEAPVDFTSNIVSNQSGTIELRATFPNDDLSLVPGQLVNVTVELSDIPDALVVTRDAINDSPTGPFVFLVRNGKAECFGPGDHCEVPAGCMHTERVGPEGVAYVAGKRSPRGAGGRKK